jgi:hypothetical protein
VQATLALFGVEAGQAASFNTSPTCVERLAAHEASFSISPTYAERLGADITADILTWDYRSYEKGHFDAIWSSPCCTHYSRARTKAKTPRNLELADSLVAKTIEIAQYFEPKVYAWENSATGLLKDTEVVRGFPWKDMAYCSFGYAYRKPTRIWTNSQVWVPRPMCTKKNPCGHMVDGKDWTSAQRGPCRGKGKGDVRSLAQLYSLPPELRNFCQDLDGRARPDSGVIFYCLNDKS